MKALSDFIAIILFFATYSITKNMVTATAVAVVIGIIQAAYTFWKEKKLEPMQWLSLILIVVFGGLTIVLQDRTFIMLKTTILTWLQAVMKREIALPQNVWNKLGYAWIIFFFCLGLLNLAIAYPFDQASEAVWVKFKVWGYMPIILIFMLAQGAYMMRHLPKED